MERVLDEHKICFITAVSDWDVYNRSVDTWQELKVPEGMEVECATVSDWTSVGEAYGMAMEQSDAKYKIYIRENVWLGKEDFLAEAIRIFQQHPEYGMVGPLGCLNLPESCLVERGDMLGRICDDHSGEMLGYIHRRSDEDASPVLLLDGYLLMTQQDVPWRSQFYDKGELYAPSQCMEFHRHGMLTAAWSQLGEAVAIWRGQQGPAEHPEAGQLVRAYKDMLLQEQPLVSVVVPVYNSEKYLQECVDSILAQTYSNLEIILVDDGSTDSSWELMNSLYGGEKRVVLLQQENQGPGAARNTGMDRAMGKYINFVDSDDFVDRDYIETLLMVAEGHQVDIAACGDRRLAVDGSSQIGHLSGMTVAGGMSALMEACSGNGNINMVPWDKLISSKTIKDNNLRWTYDGLEDVLFCGELFYYANRYVSISDMKYNYRQVETSLSHSGFGKQCNYVRIFCNILYKVQEIMERIKKDNQVSREQENKIYDFFLEVSINVLYIFFQNKREQLSATLAEEIPARFGKSAIYVEGLLWLVFRYHETFVGKKQ